MTEIHRPIVPSNLVSRAVEKRRRNGEVGSVCAHKLAAGRGWRILDVVCTCDEHDRVADEVHSHYSLALVLSGAFHYRGTNGSAHLTAGSILLGQANLPFRCWHGYGAGDRCVAVQFEAAEFEDLLASLECKISLQTLPVSLPVGKKTAGLFAAAQLMTQEANMSDGGAELATVMAQAIVGLAGDRPRGSAPIAPRHIRTVVNLARWIEEDPAAAHNIEQLAQVSGLSKYHLIRTFKRVVGLPPHAFVRRARLREAAIALAATQQPVSNVALECGFCDLSTFNGAFKQQFGAAPRVFRQSVRGDMGLLSIFHRFSGLPTLSFTRGVDDGP